MDGQLLQKNLKIPVDSLNPSKAFAEYGMDSVMAVEFAHDLETWLEHTIEPTVVWSYTTPQSLAQYLADATTGGTSDRHQITKDTSLKEMIEDDLAELLAQEIEQSKQFELLKVF